MAVIASFICKITSVRTAFSTIQLTRGMLLGLIFSTWHSHSSATAIASASVGSTNLLPPRDCTKFCPAQTTG
jgi:hypothetical protein